MISNWRHVSVLFLSFLVVAFGQPAWSVYVGFIASVIGFALFWKALSFFKCRFLIATFWFSAIQLVQLSWLFSNSYVPWFVYFIYLALAMLLGVQFGFLSWLLFKFNKLNIFSILTIASTWVLMEWGRLFVGFPWTWNPVGMAMTGGLYAKQLLSVFGIYGLSFCVIVCNLCFLKILQNQNKRVYWKLFVIVAVLPCLYGFVVVSYHNHKEKQFDNYLSALLIQTGLSPESKLGFANKNAFINPLDQWKRILNMLPDNKNIDLDLIALPEDCVPFGMEFQFHLKDAIEVLAKRFEDYSIWLPAMEDPFMQKDENKVFANNAFFAQFLANYYRSDVIAGFDDRDYHTAGFWRYNASFLFLPGSDTIDRYEKRILVPGGEYVPNNKTLQKIARNMGVMDSFTPGKRAKVFSGGASYFPSICYEDTCGHMMRDGKTLGANIYVSISNDAWFPKSKLTKQHFFHGHLRSIENGVPLLRACNTGITSAVNSFGRPVQVLGALKKPKATSGVLCVDLPLYSYKTLYSIVGDWLIVCFSFFVITSFAFLKKAKRKKH